MTNVAEAVEHYHSLLQGDLLAGAEADLERGTRERDLLYGNQPVCRLLRPFFLDAERYRGVQGSARQVARAIDGLVRRLVSDPDLRAGLHLTEDEERQARLDPGEPVEVIGRLDGFLDPEGDMRFVEFNPGVPGGLVYGDALYDVFSGMAVAEQFSRRYSMRPIPALPHVVPAFLSAFQRRGGRGLPTIALVTTSAGAGSGLLDFSEMVAVIRLLKEAGCAVLAAPCAALECRDGAVHVGDARVDVAFLADAESFPVEVGPGHGFWRAVAAGSVWIVNSPTTDVLRGHKGLFAMLTDPRYTSMFDAETRAALLRHVPWTRHVAPGRVTRGDHEVDLLPFIRGHREALVLKPAHAYGGSGVILGWECEEAAWTQGIERALMTPYVVQERVPIQRAPFPRRVNGALALEEHCVDLNPFVWNETRVAGFMVRVSRSSLLNITSGSGSAVPGALIEEAS